MKIRTPQINLTSFSLHTENSELEDLLNLFPHAAILIDLNNKRIRLANSQALEFTSYSHKELNGLEVKDFILEDDFYHLFANPHSKDDPVTIRVIKRNKSHIEVHAQLKIFPSQQKSAILYMVPKETADMAHDERDWNDNIWSSITDTLDAVQEEDLSVAVKKILTSILKLSGGDELVVYQAQSNPLELSPFVRTGLGSSLPDRLPAQSLADIHTPYISTPGKRMIPVSLASTIQLAQTANLVIIPLGEPNALIGLLVILSKRQLPDTLKLDDYARFGKVITSLIQYHLRLKNLNDEVEYLAKSASIQLAIEQAILDGVLLISPTYRILRMNSAAETILGYTNGEIKNHSVEKLLICEEDIRLILKNAIENQLSQNRISVKIFRRSGQAFLGEISVLPIIIDKNLATIAIFVRDLSEQELFQKQSMRLEKRAFLGEFTEVFAHEVRNPINNISTILQWLEYSMPPESTLHNDIKRMQLDCERLNDLMDTILSYTRTTELEMEPLILSQVVKKVIERNNPKLVQANIQIHFQDQTDSTLIQGSRRALERVFTNLIDNAKQVMNETGGNLAVRIQQISNSNCQKYIEVSVADSGPGIPKEYYERIFRPHFTTNPNGTGIGLAISHKIITLHRGTIDFESFTGGTVFHVRIPAFLPNESDLQ